MSGVKQRVAEYEAMLARRNGKAGDPLGDALQDPLTAPSSSAPASLDDLTPEQNDEYLIAIRQSYEGPEDLLKLPEWLRPLMQTADTGSNKDGVGAPEPKSSGPATATGVAPAAKGKPSVATDASAPPAERGMAPSAEEVWSNADPTARVHAAPDGVMLRSSDVMHVATQLPQATLVLQANPALQPMVAALLSTHARLMGLAGRWVALEGLSGRPDADPVAMNGQRLALVTELVAATAEGLAPASMTPSGPHIRALHNWAQREMVRLALRENELRTAQSRIQ